jgi:hypothetical protein
MSSRPTMRERGALADGQLFEGAVLEDALVYRTPRQFFMARH